MPVTPNLGIPYAVGTEFATDYPATVDEPRAMLLDTLIMKGTAGHTALPNQEIPPAALADGPFVTFPVGLFTAPPAVIATGFGQGPSFAVSVSTATPEGTQLFVYNAHPSFPVTGAHIDWAAWAIPASVVVTDDTPEVQAIYQGACQTGGCTNNGIAIGAAPAPVSGGAPFMVCGVCGVPIESVVSR